MGVSGVYRASLNYSRAHTVHRCRPSMPRVWATPLHCGWSVGPCKFPHVKVPSNKLKPNKNTWKGRGGLF